MGIDPAAAVKLIVVSHWHDDHIAGASDIVDACVKAKFACSAALRNQEFFELVLGGAHTMTEASGVSEFAAILQKIKQRHPKGIRPLSSGPEWAMANRVLWRREQSKGVPAALVEALSPSSSTLTLAHVEHAARLREMTAGPKRAVVAQQPNALSVVLRVEVGEHRVLLGSDLENCGDPQRGWSGVVADCRRAAPTGLAGVFKIPHHGSENGDHPGVWADLLHSNPVSVLTPFRKSGLPTPEDVKRLKSRTTQLYSTAPPRGPTPPRRDAMVERMQKAKLREHRCLIGNIGHVRLRFDVASSPNSPVGVALSGAASRL